MGRASVTKRERRRFVPRTAHMEVVCPGMLQVLSVGKGDLKLTVGGNDPAEIEKGRRVIEEMLRAGYAIFVETDKGLTRVKRFNPRRMTYVISDVPEGEPEEPAGKPPTRQRRTVEKHVPVAGSRSKVIGRTAGG